MPEAQNLFFPLFFFLFSFFLGGGVRGVRGVFWVFEGFCFVFIFVLFLSHFSTPFSGVSALLRTWPCTDCVFRINLSSDSSCLVRTVHVFCTSDSEYT